LQEDCRHPGAFLTCRISNDLLAYLEGSFETMVGKKRYRFYTTVIILICLSQQASAQLASKSQEVWPSIDAYYRINPAFRIYATVAGTKLSESSYSEGAFGIFLDYFTFPPRFHIPRGHNDSLPGKYIWLRVGYQYSASPPSADDPFRENMVVIEGNSRFYLPSQVMLTWKNRFDGRLKNGDFNVRYRPRIMFERDFKTEFLSFTGYVFGEYFVNFSQASVNRFRTQAGIEIRVTKEINYEVFWNHQFQNQPEISEVDAFGMTLKLYFSGRKRTERKAVPTQTD
jgi:hypothetical protein